MRGGEAQRQGLPVWLVDLVWRRGLGARRDRVHVSTGLGSATVLGQRRGPVMPDSPLGPAAFAGFHCRLPLRSTWGFACSLYCQEPGAMRRGSPLGGCGPARQGAAGDRGTRDRTTGSWRKSFLPKTMPRCGSSWPRRCAKTEEHTSELQSLMRISYAVFCLKK